MAWGIEKSNLVLLVFDLVSTDVLSDPAGFTSGHIGLTDRVEQRGLTVVNVAKDTNNRRTRLEKARVIVCNFCDLLLFSDLGLSLATMVNLQLEAMTLGNLNRDGLFDGLIHRCKNAHFHQLRNELERLHFNLSGEIAHHNRRLGVNDALSAFSGFS